MTDLTVSQVAKIAGCHINTVKNYEKHGYIEAMRDNNNIRRYLLSEALKLKEILNIRTRGQKEGSIMAQPVHIRFIIREIMQMLERRRQLEKQLASRPQGQGCGVSARQAGVKSENLNDGFQGESKIQERIR